MEKVNGKVLIPVRRSDGIIRLFHWSDLEFAGCSYDRLNSDLVFDTELLPTEVKVQYRGRNPYKYRCVKEKNNGRFRVQDEEVYVLYRKFSLPRFIRSYWAGCLVFGALVAVLLLYVALGFVTQDPPARNAAQEASEAVGAEPAVAAQDEALLAWLRAPLSASDWHEASLHERLDSLNRLVDADSLLADLYGGMRDTLAANIMFRRYLDNRLLSFGDQNLVWLAGQSDLCLDDDRAAFLKEIADSRNRDRFVSRFYPNGAQQQIAACSFDQLRDRWRTSAGE